MNESAHASLSDPELRRRRVCAQISVAMPEFGWSVSEALFMPLLLTLHVPMCYLTVCWIFSPLIGICMQPYIGALSDSHGRRPGILFLGFMAACGLAALPLCSALQQGAVAAAIAVFAVTDISHDLLLTPTRAAMNDVFDTETCERRCAMLAGGGKLFALLIVSVFPAPNTAFRIVAGLMAFATASQLLTKNVAHSTQDPTNSEVQASRDFPQYFLLLWIVSCIGWISICIFSFYFTSVWIELSGKAGENSNQAIRTASMILVCHAFVFTVVGSVVPKFVSLVRGEINAMICALIFLGAAMLSFFVLPRFACAAVCVFLAPLGYQVVANTPFAWLENQQQFMSSTAVASPVG